jgi:hypothetical protein
MKRCPVEGGEEDGGKEGKGKVRQGQVGLGTHTLRVAQAVQEQENGGRRLPWVGVDKGDRTGSCCGEGGVGGENGGEVFLRGNARGRHL